MTESETKNKGGPCQNKGASAMAVEAAAADVPEPEPATDDAEPEPEPAAPEPEPAADAAAPPAASTDAAGLITSEKKRSDDRGVLVPSKLPQGWVDLPIDQRILNYHPTVKVRARVRRAQVITSLQ